MSSPVWDPRLITPDRVIALVGTWPLYADQGIAELSQYAPEGGGPAQRDQTQINLRCGRSRCGQSITLLARNETPELITTSNFLAAVLRHAVMVHDVPLSGAVAEGNGNGR